MKENDRVVTSTATGLQAFNKLGRVDVEQGSAGDIVAVTGLEEVEIGDTLCQRGEIRPLPRLRVDEPTLEMVFSINSSPLAGRMESMLRRVS